MQASVGVANGKQCYNTLRDQNIVIDLLNRIPGSLGGTAENPLSQATHWGVCPPRLHRVIYDFQLRHRLSADGHVDPGEATIKKLNELANANNSLTDDDTNKLIMDKITPLLLPVQNDVRFTGMSISAYLLFMRSGLDTGMFDLQRTKDLVDKYFHISTLSKDRQVHFLVAIKDVLSRISWTVMRFAPAAEGVSFEKAKDDGAGETGILAYTKSGTEISRIRIKPYAMTNNDVENKNIIIHESAHYMTPGLKDYMYAPDRLGIAGKTLKNPPSRMVDLPFDLAGLNADSYSQFVLDMTRQL
jgi:hypothetical protein